MSEAVESKVVKYSLFYISKLSFRQLRNEKTSTLLFIFSLAIGLSAFVSVDSFKNAIEANLKSQSRAILAADIGIGARQPIDDKTLSKAKNILGDRLAATSKSIESFTMLSSQSTSRLVEVKAIESNYPFYGEIVLSNTKMNSTQAYNFPDFGALMYPETLTQLGLNIGDKIQLGGQSFTISEKIISDPSSIGGGFNFAPKIYISYRDFDKAGFIKEGSTAYRTILFKLKNIGEVEVAEKLLTAELTDPSLRILTPEKTSQQVGRLLNYLSDYLSLASLVALFLSAFGCGYLYNSFLNKNAKNIALFKVVGLRPADVRKLYLFHTLILSLAAFFIVSVFCYFFLPQLSSFGAEFLNMDFRLQLSASTLVTGAIVSIFGGLLINYPLIRLIDKVQAKKLISQQSQSIAINTKDLLYYLPIFILFIVLTFVLSKSVQSGTYFLIGIFSSSIILFFASKIFSWALSKVGKSSSFAINWMILSLYRNLREFRFAYFCMSIGIVLILLLPLLEQSIQNEIKSPDSTKTPSLFLFDIQTDQYEPLLSFLNNEKILIQSLSPMIRSRLELVNGEKLERYSGETLTREQQEENRWRNRGYNLSYRSELSDSERIIDGQFWTGPSENPDELQISIESRFADRLKLKLGDLLEFNVEGIPVKGRFTSIRKIKWTSFQPNFFIQLQPADFLKDLPQTFVMAVKSKDEQGTASLQNQLAQKFPSISVIDVLRVSERLTAIITQLSAALQLVGITSLIVGLLIFFAMINQRTKEKRKQANLLRILGARNSIVYASVLGEFLLLILLSLLSGLFLSLTFNAALMAAVFDSIAHFSLTQLLVSCLVIVAVSLAITFLSLKNSLSSNPNELLKES